MCVRVFEDRCAVAPTTNVDAGGCSLDNSVENDSDYHMESFLDSDDQSHNGPVQSVDDDKVKELLSNDDNSHIRLQQVF